MLRERVMWFVVMGTEFGEKVNQSPEAVIVITLLNSYAKRENLTTTFFSINFSFYDNFKHHS